MNLTPEKVAIAAFAVAATGTLYIAGHITVMTTSMLTETVADAGHTFGESLKSPDAQMTDMIMGAFARDNVDTSKLVPVTLEPDDYIAQEFGTTKYMQKAFMAVNSKLHIIIGEECVPKAADQLGTFETSGALNCYESFQQDITLVISSKVKAQAFG